MSLPLLQDRRPNNHCGNRDSGGHIGTCRAHMAALVQSRILSPYTHSLSGSCAGSSSIPRSDLVRRRVSGTALSPWYLHSGRSQVPCLSLHSENTGHGCHWPTSRTRIQGGSTGLYPCIRILYILRKYSLICISR